MEKFRVISLTLIVTLFFFIFSLYFGTKSVVALEIQGERRELSTHVSTVRGLLEQVGIDYKEQDYLTPPLDTKLQNDLVVKWMPSHHVNVIDANISIEKWTTEVTIEQFLKDNNIVLLEKDVVTPELETIITSDTEINIKRAFEININVDGATSVLRSPEVSVEEFLTSAGIIINDIDRVTPPLEEFVSEGITVEIVRVVRDIVEEEEEIPYTVQFIEDDTSYVGEEKVTQEGSNGLLKKMYEITRENDVEVNKVETGSEIILEATAKIVMVGNKPLLVAEPSINNATISRSEKPTEYARVLTVESTAYALSGRTATGFDLTNNMDAKIIAVDPKVIPLGTEVYVEGYGYAVAADTGGVIKGNIIDVHFSTYDQAIKWGRRSVQVYILS